MSVTFKKWSDLRRRSFYARLGWVHDDGSEDLEPFIFMRDDNAQTYIKPFFKDGGQTHEPYYDNQQRFDIVMKQITLTSDYTGNRTLVNVYLRLEDDYILQPSTGGTGERYPVSPSAGTGSNLRL